MGITLENGSCMSLALIHSRARLGLQAPAVTVEVHLANGLPSFTLVGLADTEVKEARERVRCAIQNAGLEFPSNKRVKCSQGLYRTNELSRGMSN
jgi:magnesium chelatase family protein